MYIQTVIFAYYFVIIAFALIFLIDFKLYVNTPKVIRRSWPPWAYLPGGAIIAHFKYRKTD